MFFISNERNQVQFEKNLKKLDRQSQRLDIFFLTVVGHPYSECHASGQYDVGFQPLSHRGYRQAVTMKILTQKPPKLKSNVHMNTAYQRIFI